MTTNFMHIADATSEKLNFDKLLRKWFSVRVVVVVVVVGGGLISSYDRLMARIKHTSSASVWINAN